MTFQSLYYLTDNTIVYQHLHRSGNVIPFSDFNMIAEYRPAFYTSKALDTLLQDSQSTRQATYHLAAIHQKYIPANWDWEHLLYFKEQQCYEKTAGEFAYMKAKGMTSPPVFYHDYDAIDYEIRIEKWAKERGVYRSREEILDQTSRNIQELIYDRSKTDFIRLTEDQIQIIKGVE